MCYNQLPDKRVGMFQGNKLSHSQCNLTHANENCSNIKYLNRMIISV